VDESFLILEPLIHPQITQIKRMIDLKDCRNTDDNSAHLAS